MEATEKSIIEIEAGITAPVEKVWEYFTKPEHIIKWNNASDDWYTPRAESDLRAGGKFVYRMEAKDGSFSFDFGGTYEAVDENKYLEYQLDDKRKVKVTFTAAGDETRINEVFEAETVNSIELQKTGWQNILDNFKKYTEAN